MNEDSKPTNSIDLAAARAKLEREGGKKLWQSLEQLSDTPEYRKFLENEFPVIPAKPELANKVATSTEWTAATC